MDGIVRPTRGRILVRRADEVEQIGSIIVPDGARERPSKGVVVSVGAGVTWVQPGETVMYSAGGRRECLLDGVLHQIIAERDLFGVLDNAA